MPSRSTCRQAAGSVAAALTLLAVLAVWAAGPAAAHAKLLSTDPAEGAMVATAPAAISLRFDEPPVAQYSTIHVTGPDGTRHDAGAPTLAGPVLSEKLTGALSAGAYTVAWRVVSDDGHPVSGQFRFTASAGATTSAAPSAGRAPIATPPPSSTVLSSTRAAKDSSHTGIYVGIGVAAVLLIAFVAVLTLRRRKPATHE